MDADPTSATGSATGGSPPPAAQPDPLRLEYCPACGYALAGLPDEGACPECGAGYDQHTVVLHGWACGSRANLANASPGAAAGQAVVYAVIGLLILRAALGGSLLAPSLVAVGAAAVGWMLWRRWTTDLPGLIQVRLCDQGCVQLDNPRAPAPAPTRWAEVADVLIEPTGRGTYLLQCSLVRTRRMSKSKPVPRAVDAELRCTPEQASALWYRIMAWRAR